MRAAYVMVTVRRVLLVLRARRLATVCLAIASTACVGVLLGVRLFGVVVNSWDTVHPLQCLSVQCLLCNMQRQ